MLENNVELSQQNVCLKEEEENKADVRVRMISLIDLHIISYVILVTHGLR